MNIIQRTSALVAVLFGLLTIVAGSKVFFGADPGYIVYPPLLAFNTAMGIVYVVAGVIIFFSLAKGMYVSAGIFAINGAVLIAIYFLHTQGSPVAVESVHAMVLRTLVWLVLLAIVASLHLKNRRYSEKSST